MFKYKGYTILHVIMGLDLDGRSVFVYYNGKFFTDVYKTIDDAKIAIDKITEERE